MKKILSGALVALSLVGFVFISGVSTPAVASPIGPMCWAGSCPDMSRPGALAEASSPSGPYACMSSPAYTFYYGASATACPGGGKLAVIPSPKSPR